MGGAGGHFHLDRGDERWITDGVAAEIAENLHFAIHVFGLEKAEEPPLIYSD